MPRLKAGPKILLILLLLGVVGYTVYRYWPKILELAGMTSQGSQPDATGSSKASGTYQTAAKTATTNRVRVRVNIWVGCVPGLVANGGLDTQPGSIFDRQGLQVEFKIIDDWTEGAASLATGNVDVMLTTVDVYAKDYYQFSDKKFATKTILMVDWSRGGDGIIARQGINSIEDLAGKTIAFPEYTPSHFLLHNALKQSGLNSSQVTEILNRAVHTKDGIDSATIFGQQKVDAAVAWEPDMSDAVSKRAGSKKIFDTRVANKLIADILIVGEKFSQEQGATITKFIDGWLQGVEFIKQQPQRAYTIIGTIKDFNIPSDLAKMMLEGVKLSDYAENAQFFALQGGISDYDNIFNMAQDTWRDLRVIKKSSDPASSLETRFLKSLASKYPVTTAPESPTYSAPAKSAVPIMTQQKSIYYEVNSAKMSLDSRTVVEDIGSFMRAYENTVVDIEGNTDSTGNREYNMELSRQRADSVKSYLMQKFGYPASRIRTFGNGPDRPVDNNSTPEGREKNRRTDIKVYPNPASK